jgi:hypothetical protein
MPKYSILTIGYKSLENIKNRINEAYEFASPDEFIVVINYYSEESWKILDYVKNDPRVTRYCFSSQNIGFAKAINLAYKISKNDHLIMLSDDCSVKGDSYLSLSNSLLEDHAGISCVKMGGDHRDCIPIPQGFLLGLKRQMIKDCGDYIYDEVASPLGCERELTYRAKSKNYNLVLAKECQFSHSHDISANPSRMINYLGENMSPQGENPFQFESEIKLNQLIEKHKKIIFSKSE